jgi:hypothetical protein
MASTDQIGAPLGAPRPQTDQELTLPLFMSPRQPKQIKTDTFKI